MKHKNDRMPQMKVPPLWSAHKAAHRFNLGKLSRAFNKQTGKTEQSRAFNKQTPLISCVPGKSCLTATELRGNTRNSEKRVSHLQLSCISSNFCIATSGTLAWACKSQSTTTHDSTGRLTAVPHWHELRWHATDVLRQPFVFEASPKQTEQKHDARLHWRTHTSLSLARAVLEYH